MYKNKKIMAGYTLIQRTKPPFDWDLLLTGLGLAAVFALSAAAVAWGWV